MRELYIYTIKMQLYIKIQLRFLIIKMYLKYALCIKQFLYIRFFLPIQYKLFTSVIHYALNIESLYTPHTSSSCCSCTSAISALKASNMILNRTPPKVDPYRFLDIRGGWVGVSLSHVVLMRRCQTGESQRIGWKKCQSPLDRIIRYLPFSPFKLSNFLKDEKKMRYRRPLTVHNTNKQCPPPRIQLKKSLKYTGKIKETIIKIHIT